MHEELYNTGEWNEIESQTQKGLKYVCLMACLAGTFQVTFEQKRV